MIPSAYKSSTRSERLSALADDLAGAAFDVATLEQQMIKIQGGSWHADRETRYRTLAAAQSLMVHLLAVGLDAQLRKRGLPEWLTPLLDQIDSAYMAELPAPVLERVDG